MTDCEYSRMTVCEARSEEMSEENSENRGIDDHGRSYADRYGWMFIESRKC